MGVKENWHYITIKCFHFDYFEGKAGYTETDAFSFGLFFFALEAASKPKLIPAPPRPISSISTTISSLFLFHGFEC